MGTGHALRKRRLERFDDAIDDRRKGILYSPIEAVRMALSNLPSGRINLSGRKVPSLDKAHGVVLVFVNIGAESGPGHVRVDLIANGNDALANNL